ncbi:uncharacterized protein LOC126908045 [Daktulosphaira vitifoliae]|uniref:uncharacterized protein LOC126908045 n=1 Tax=Daktulosphaira vitifoliae TaxID=58002 RepID=UPI0021AAD540|nr:uncharacterized protein LOC126908045 [Daktulosphaira vitifoliae]XP_050545834.1 uncharacterized protein LOC126908045 [Daktulosphaira vitifoliae]XP_050545835.1 uncharacterized protein LOC126908045 [Daktulosphaira vitifoliae]XP_050545836.1 uncharacterized protein LOC126908045 [Daktulosphaira vitifoliae]XP_050545838.1 uncharacterized protein LOC126908045 [Daktulosphaira vitifoliae]XP_050545839.1 uncharacterized protein LOC126908045 [Daktulosphaira vitifoliae]
MTSKKNVISFFTIVIFNMYILKGFTETVKNDLIEAARTIEWTNRLINRKIQLNDGQIIRYAESDRFYETIRSLVLHYKDRSYETLIMILIPLKIEQIIEAEKYITHIIKKEKMFRIIVNKHYTVLVENYQVFESEHNLNYIDAINNRKQIIMPAIRYLLYIQNAMNDLCSPDNNLKCKLMGIEKQFNTPGTMTISALCTKNNECVVGYTKSSQFVLRNCIFIGEWDDTLNYYSIIEKKSDKELKYYAPELTFLREFYKMDDIELIQESLDMK